MYNGLITHLNIGVKRLENDIKNVSEDDVKNRRLNYFKDLVETTVNASQKQMKKVKNLLQKDKKDKD